MPGFLHLLRCVGKAAVKHAVRALVGLVPMGREVYDMARDALDDYRGQKQEAELRRAASIAQVNPAEARQTAAQVTQEVAGDQPPEVQRALTTYLSQVPAAVRQSLRRPADPTGTTLPAGLSLKRPEDLLPFLPVRLPRFQPGDCPPGVGDWQLVELLGTGGFGEVWKARHLTLASRQPVALKFCLDAAAAAALRNEAQLLDHVMQQGRHPGIVPLLQTYLRADPPCLEYEYVEGGDLSALMQEQMARDAASPEFATKIILHIAKTIAFAHRLSPPIVHRDLKPANILVQRNADGKVTLRVADFGIGGIAAAQVIRQETGRPQSREQSLPSAVRGAYTPLYASPQQRRGDPPDPRDDIHALGVMWYQFLVGDLTAERPGGRGWRKKLENRGMAAGLIDLLESCIDDDTSERPANAELLAAQIEHLLNPPTASQPKALHPASALPTAIPGSPIATTFPAEEEEIHNLDLVNSLGMTLVFVARGTFWTRTRGSREQLTMPYDFFIGKYLVTQEEWQRLMGSNPSYFSRTGGGAPEVKGCSDAELKLFPVECVSWDDVQEFLNRLNGRDKKSGLMYRLPTEAEWEYACRGGVTCQDEFIFDFYFSQPDKDLSAEQANFNGNYPAGNATKGKYLQRTTKVGSYPPNRLGICDMHGNVWEWCDDYYQVGFSPRALRGGCWDRDGTLCRVSARRSCEPSKRENNVGFRIVAIPSPE